MAVPTKLLVEDLYSRKIIGGAFGKIMDAYPAETMCSALPLNQSPITKL